MSAFSPILPAVTEAPLQFLRPMPERPFSYQYDPPEGTAPRNGTYDPHLVRIRNARPLVADLSLDAEGFTLVRAPDFSDYDDDAAIRSVYFPAVEELIAAAIGAEHGEPGGAFLLAALLVGCGLLIVIFGVVRKLGPTPEPAPAR